MPGYCCTNSLCIVLTLRVCYCINSSLLRSAGVRDSSASRGNENITHYRFAVVKTHAVVYLAKANFT